MGAGFIWQGLRKGVTGAPKKKQTRLLSLIVRTQIVDGCEQCLRKLVNEKYFKDLEGRKKSGLGRAKFSSAGVLNIFGFSSPVLGHQ